MHKGDFEIKPPLSFMCIGIVSLNQAPWNM